MVDLVATCRLASIGLLAATPSIAWSAPEPAGQRQSNLFASSDVFNLERAADVQISPDGGFIVYVRYAADIAIDGENQEVRLVDTRTKLDRFLASGASNPRWSPDGSRIAFIKHGASGRSELHVIGRGGGNDHVVADLSGDLSAPVWSPQGRAIAFARTIEIPPQTYLPPVDAPPGAKWAAAPRIITTMAYQQDGERFGQLHRTGLFRVGVSGGMPQSITPETTDVSGDPVWTHGGDALLFTATEGKPAPGSYFTNRIYRVPASGGTPAAVSPPDLASEQPAVSSDGRWIAFVGRKPNGHDYIQGGLFLMTPDGRQVRQLARSVDREIQMPRFSSDSCKVYVSYGDKGHQVLASVTLAGARSVILQDLGDDGTYSVSDEGDVGFASSPSNRPADAAVLAHGSVKRLTRMNESLLASKTLAQAQSLVFKSASDNAEVGAWLMLPPRARAMARHPLILSIHGGPHGFDDPGWSTQDQLFAAAGYAVLHVNYRGSTSYGYAFADRIARDFPGPAYDDLMSGVDAAVAAGLADPDRLFVMGGSAGGELTAWIVGRTTRFKAAVAVKPVINITSESLTTEQYAYAVPAYGALPWEDPQLYWRRSPLSLVAKVTTPTMLMVGELDHNTSAGEAEQFYGALQLLKRPSALVIVPDAGHSSIAATPSRLIAGTAIMLDWFARHGGITAPVVMSKP